MPARRQRPASARSGGRRSSAYYGSSGPTFDPTTVSGLVAWFDFGDPTTLFTDTSRTTAVSADGNSIKGVTDKSTGGTHLSEATNPPTYKTAIANGRSAALFNGTSSRLMASGGSGATVANGSDAALSVVTVVQPVSGSNRTVTGWGDSADASNDFWFMYCGGSFFASTQKKDALATGVTAADVNITLTNSNNYVISWVCPGTTASAWVNGAATSVAGSAFDVGATTIDQLTIGALTRAAASVNFYRDYVFEVLVFNVALSTGNRQYIEHGLGQKWGISVP